MTVIKVISVGIPGLNGQDAVGAVKSVNTIEPDDAGALTLTAADIGADEEGAAAQALTDANSYTDGIADNKADLIDGLVPANQLPSYVDDVLEYANLASFPVTGSIGKIYVALDTNLTYRWTGSIYAALDPSLALGETSQTAYRGDRGKTAYDHSQSTGNPHNTSIDDISGLRAALSGGLTLSSTSSVMTIFDDFFYVEDTKTLSSTVSGVDEIPVSSITGLGLNWVGAIRVFDSSTGGYYRANCPNKTATTLFNFLEPNGIIDFTTEIYIPASALSPTTTDLYFVGIVNDHPSNVGLTGAAALVMWDANSANWRLRLANGTFVDTGVAASKGTKFKIEIRQTDDTVAVKINNTEVVAARSNPINEGAVLPCCAFAHQPAGTMEIWQDYMGLRLSLDTARANFGFSF